MKAVFRKARLFQFVVGVSSLMLGACSTNVINYKLKSAANDLSSTRGPYETAHSTGDNASLREYWLRDKANVVELGTKSHTYACDALMEIGDFREAKTCLDLLPEQEAYDWMSQSFNQETNRYYGDALRSRYHFLIGDYAGAIRLADGVLEHLTMESGVMSFGISPRDQYFWYGRMTAGYAAGMSELALGKGRISDQYSQAVDNDYIEGIWLDQNRKLYVTRKAEMLFVEQRYAEALELLTGQKSENSTSDKVRWIVTHVQALGIAAVIGYLKDGDANLTGENRWSGDRHIHQYMIAKAKMELGQVEEARALYDALLETLKDASYVTFYWRSAHDRALIAQREGDVALADRLYRDAVSSLEQQRSTLTTDGSKISFVGDKQRLYQDYVAFLISQQRYTQAFEYSDKAKARALVDMLANREVSTDVQREDQKLYQELKTLQADLAMLTGAGSDAQKAEKTRALKRTYNAIKVSNPQLSSLVSAETPNASEIQRKLRNNETLIQFYKLRDRYHAFVVTQKAVSSYALPQADIDVVDDEVSAFRQALLDVNSERYREPAQSLYNRLLRPMAGKLRNRDLVVVADGSLHYLPFKALHDGKQFVLQGNALRKLSAASMVTFLQQRDVRGERLMALGNPDLGDPDLELPGAEQEVKALQAILQDSDVVTRAQATESRIKNMGSDYSVLHIASHGKFDSDQPLASRLMLAADAANDGVLTVGELYDTQLPVSLVVLSACETGLGEVKNGGDVIGLTRGFLYAGASSVVSTLWIVEDDTTRRLMLEFYSRLQRQSQQDIGVALNGAQRTIFTTVNPHPYYWAAFQLTGSS